MGRRGRERRLALATLRSPIADIGGILPTAVAAHPVGLTSPARPASVGPYLRKQIERIAAATRDPLEIFLGVLRANMNEPGLIELFARVSLDAANPTHFAHGYMKQRYLRAKHTAEQVLRDGIDGGHLCTDTDVTACASALMASMDGLQTQWLLSPAEIDVSGIFTRTYRSILTISPVSTV